MKMDYAALIEALTGWLRAYLERASAQGFAVQ